MRSLARAGSTGSVRELASAFEISANGKGPHRSDRTEVTGGWDAAQMLKLARRHARLEALQRLDELMETVIEEPEYEFYPLKLRMRGGDLCRRYYDPFFSDFTQRVVGHVLLEEWVSPTSVAQEYGISIRIGDDIETHRVLGVLFAEGDRLDGERIYGSERILREMAGCVIDEFEAF